MHILAVDLSRMAESRPIPGHGEFDHHTKCTTSESISFHWRRAHSEVPDGFLQWQTVPNLIYRHQDKLLAISLIAKVATGVSGQVDTLDVLIKG